MLLSYSGLRLRYALDLGILSHLNIDIMRLDHHHYQLSTLNKTTTAVSKANVCHQQPSLCVRLHHPLSPVHVYPWRTSTRRALQRWLRRHLTVQLQEGNTQHTKENREETTTTALRSFLFGQSDWPAVWTSLRRENHVNSLLSEYLQVQQQPSVVVIAAAYTAGHTKT